MQAKINIVVVDKLPIVRWSLRDYFTDHHNIAVIATAESYSEALSVMRSTKPDVVVLDMSSTDANAVHKLITQVCVQVVAFSNIDTWDDIEAFFEAGGMGLVHRTSPLDDLVKAIEAAADKQRWIASALRTIDSTSIIEGADSELTKRKYEIVTHITNGLVSKQIAEQPCQNINTLKSHRKSAVKKLKVH